MKTEATHRIERLLLNKFNDRNDFYVFECTLGWYGNEIVDCVSYNCQREITCYEIKQSVSDFHSKNVVSFFGNTNYYVMPYKLYLQVKDEIPLEIGVYVACTREPKYEKTLTGTKCSMEISNGFTELYCIHRAKNRLLRADKEIILSSMLRCACRDRRRGSLFANEELIYETAETLSGGAEWEE